MTQQSESLIGDRPNGTYTVTVAKTGDDRIFITKQYASGHIVDKIIGLPRAEWLAILKSL